MGWFFYSLVYLIIVRMLFVNLLKPEGLNLSNIDLGTAADVTKLKIYL
jgi:hypothetical protein